MAVYTEVSDDALRAFLADYDIGNLVAFRGIAEGVENSNFMLRTETGRTQPGQSQAGDYILTLYEQRVDPADLPWFLGLMRHLSDRGITCPLPVEGRDGSALRMLCGRHAAITTFLPGVWPRRVQVAHCGPVGAALAGLHLAGADYPDQRVNALGLEAWTTLLDQCTGRADTVQAGLARELAEGLGRVQSGWPTGLPRGHIHADLFADNVFFLDGRLSGLIDFFFACTDFYAYDLAVCINAWCFEADGSMSGAKVAALLHGYGQVRRLRDDEVAALPVLCAGAALRFALTRLFDWLNPRTDALVTHKDPLDYVRRMRFHLTVRDARAYGA